MEVDAEPVPADSSRVELRSLRSRLAEAQEVVRTSRRLRHALESAGLCAWEWDIQLRCVYWSNNLERILRCCPSTYVQSIDTWHESIEPGDLADLTQALERSRQAGCEFEVTYRVSVPDLPPRWIQCNGSFELDSAGAATWGRGTILDVTRHLTSEQALRNINEGLEREVHRRTGCLRLVHETAEVSNRSVSVQMAVKDCLDSICAHFDWCIGHAWIRSEQEPDSFVDMGVWHQGAGEQFTALVEAVRNMSLDAKSGPIGEVVSGRAPRNGYLPDERIHLPPELAAGIRTVLWAPVSTTNGVAAILEFFSGARVDLDDPLVDVLCGVGDQLGRVIERERSHRLLMQAERLVSVGTFAAGIAHEVNNPLSSVLLTARFAQKILDRPDEVQQLLEEIVQDAERCGRIVRSVSKFARNDSSDKAMIDLQAAIRAARLLVLGQAKRANVALVMNLMDQPLWMLGNQIEIEQALVNLLHNSLQASSPDNNIEIRSGKLAGFLQVQVQDHGCGMDDHTLRHAFDPFYSTRTQQGGTGLGLSLVHGLVRDHKGFIDIQSTVGKGTRVTLRFPEAAPGAAALNQRSEYRKRGSAYIFEP